MNNIKQIRKSQGLSVTALAQKLNMSQGNLTKIENGQVELRLETAKQIAEALDMPLDKILSASSPNDDVALTFDLPLGSLTWRAPDDTMTPTVNKGDIVVYKTDDRKHEDGLYLIDEGAHLKVRRLQTLSDGQIAVLCDNGFYRQEVRENIKVAGKVTHKISLQVLK